MLSDDSSLSKDDRDEVSNQARLALLRADALGIFPTPVDEIMRAAKIEVVPFVLDETYLAKLRRKAEQAGRALLSAISKVWGVFDPHARVAFIDPDTPKEKLPFLKLHEGGHAMLPWQSIFGHFEDCRKTLDPDTKAAFERQANVFASDVLFQLDQFTSDAHDLPFGIDAVLRLAKRYGASLYSTARRYAAVHERACAVMVFNPVEIHADFGAIAMLRRVETSPRFDERFGAFAWPEWVSTKDPVGKLIPFSRMTRPRSFAMRDRNGAQQEFVGEAFKTSHQILILIHALEAQTGRLVVPAQPVLI